MIYIDGYGYVDDSIHNVNNTNYISGVSSRTNVSNIINDTFENLLNNETAKLNNKSTTYNLDDIFEEASKKYDVSVDLLKAIAYNESGFKADATSHAGAMGIMQLMPATAKYLGVEDAYDPYQNIMGGAKLLSQLDDMYNGNKTLMIAAYNAGAGNVEKYGGVPPFKETQNYVQKVLSTLQTGVNTEGITVTSNEQIKVSSNPNDNFSYDEYELLMTYFEHMLEIISSIGETDSSSSESEDDSLSNLFRLGGSIIYNSSTIDL